MAAIALMAVASYAASAAGIAGTIGASLLTGAASIVGGLIDNALFGKKGPSIEGPRITDGKVTSATFGQPIALAFGTVRMGGLIIWAGKLTETPHTQRAKGGKGGMFGGKKGGSSTTYTYSRSFAVALCEGPIVSVKRIWADSKLLYNNGSQQAATAVRVYLGTDSQSADSLIQATEGAANVPAYRGIAYIVFDNLQLADWANRIPNITVEVEAGAATVGSVAGSLCARVGLTDVDVTGAAGLPVRGYLVGAKSTARAALETLAVPFNVLGVNRKTGLAFVDRGKFALWGIDESDIGLAPDQPPEEDVVQLVRRHDSDLPKEFAVTFLDPARDYQENTQRAQRQVGYAQGRAMQQLPIVLSADEGKQLAEKLLYDVWARRNSIEEITLPPAYMGLQAGDVVDVKLLGRFERSRVVKVAIGADNMVKAALQFEDSAHFLSAAIAGTGAVPGQAAGAAPNTIAIYLDIPLLREEDDDWGFTVSVDSAGQALWRGMTLWRSPDNVTYEEILAIGTPGVTGTCDTTLPSAGWHVVDRASTLDVTLTSTEDQLYTISDADLLNYGNFAAVGSQAGGWEILQFQTATLLSAGRYRLSNLLRGRRGTDWKVGGHAAAEKFILLNAGFGLARVIDAQSLLGSPRYYKPVSTNQAVSGVSSSVFTNTGVVKKPLSPSLVRGRLETSGDITITWLNRSRMPNDWPSGQDVPLGEESERYQLEVYNGGNVVRTAVIAAAKTFVYTLAMQAADFGAIQSTYAIKIAQLGGSGVVGYKTDATVPTIFASALVSYAYWDPNDKAPNHTLTNSNLTIENTSTANGYTTGFGTNRPQGKYYWEGTIIAKPGAGVGQAFGLTNALAANNTFPSSGAGWDHKAAGDGNLYEEATDWGDISGGASQWQVNDVIQCAWDADLDKGWYRKNGGQWNNTTDDPTTNVGGRSTTGGGNPLYVLWDTNVGGTGQKLTANFGGTAFAGAVPAGFKSGFRLDEVGRVWSLWSGSDKTANLTVSEGNQRGQVAAAAFNGVRSDIGRSSGNLYAEIIVNSQGANFGLGIADATASLSAQLGGGPTAVAYRPNGDIVTNGSVVTTAASYVNGDVIGIAINLATRKAWFRKGSGAWNNSGSADPVVGTEGISLSALAATVHLALVSDTSGHAATINCGSAEYRVTPPTGYGAIYT